MPIAHTLSELLALPATAKPRYPYLKSLAQHVQEVSLTTGLTQDLIAGGSAGDHTVTGIATTDTLVFVLHNTAGTFADLTSEFSITAANTINNVGGTDTTGDQLLVLYQTGGNPASWGDPLDSRWYVATTGTDTYSATTTPAATGSDNLSSGYKLVIKFGNTNTSTTCTLDIGTAEAAEPIKVIQGDGTVGDPPVGFLTGYMEGIYDGDNNRWLIPENRVSGSIYSVITANTTLVAGTDYLDTSTADRTHTLPAKSGSSAGDRISVAAGAAGVKIVKQNVADSSGSPLTVLFAMHDYVEFVYDGTNWVKTRELFTGVVDVALTADETGITTTQQVFDGGNVSVVRDTTSQWDSVTNHRYDNAALWPDCYIDATFRMLGQDKAFVFPNVNGVDVIDEDVIGDAGGAIHTFIYKHIRVDAGEYLQWMAHSSSSSTLYGDAALDECRFTLEIKEWVV